MKVVTTFHASSAVSHSLKCNLTVDLDVEHLVIAQLNKVHVFSCRSHGLQHETCLEIWGRIVSIKSIPIQNCQRSNLLIMIDHPIPELIFLTYSVSSSAGCILTTTKKLSLYERSPRQAEYLNDILVDPSGSLAVVSCYTGKLKFILFKDGNYEGDFDLSISELNILSLAFVPAVDNLFSLAILHQDHRERIQLLSRDINVADMELLPSFSPVLQSTLISSRFLLRTESLPILVYVAPSPEEPNFSGGVLLIGGRKILLFELTTNESREKQKGKHRRTQTRKKSTDITEVQRARQKEMERESRKRKPGAMVEWPWSEVTAWCTVGKNPTRFLLGDSFGRLAMLFVNQSKDLALFLLPLGEVSPASSLTYLTTQMVFLGSHLGDSQLLRINSIPAGSLDTCTLPMPTHISAVRPALRMFSPTNDEVADPEIEGRTGCIIENKGRYVTVLRTFKNIAPIVDAVLVETEGTGQPHIVTCSGGRNTGSLNVIRNGADFEELAVIEGINDVTSIWPIRAFFKDDFDSHILVSTIQDTHLFRFDGTNLLSRVVPVSMGFVLNLPTLAARNISKRFHSKGSHTTSSYGDSSLVIQVTPRALILLEFEPSLGEYTQVGETWTSRNLSEPLRQSSQADADSQIVAASVNPSQFVLALSGARIVLLNLNGNDKFRIMSDCNVGNETINHHEISAVSCIPQDPSKYYSTFVTVSFWGSNCVEVFSIERPQSRLSSICKTSTLPSIPRSLLLYDFARHGHGSDGPENHTHLLVGLGNGMIMSFALKDRELVDQRTVFLGGAPVCMTACEVDGRPAVFASGNRASLFFWNKNRLQYSPVISKDIVAASRLNTRGFPSCLILATVSGLSIGKARELDEIHIRSVPLGLDNPRRITYDRLHQVIGVACTRSEAVQVGEPESPRSFFRLLDASSLIHLSQFNCEPDEEITAVETLPLMLDGCSLSYFCVGTFFYQADEKEPIAGRLLVFFTHGLEGSLSYLPSRRLSLIASVQVQGCVYALANANGMIAAAINASVVIYRLDRVTHRSTLTFALNKLTEWTHNYLVRSLVSHDDHLVLGDAISSVSILKLADTQLNMVARDYGPLWPVCVQALDKGHVIGANADLNIFTFTLQHLDAQAILEVDGSYHVADMVTKFLPGSLTPSKLLDDVILEPQQLFFTSSGSIGVIIDIGENLAFQLAALQRNMASIIQGKGSSTHTKYRAPKNSRGVTNASYGFLDGDFLEQFLVCTSFHEKILAGRTEAERLTMTKTEILNVLEMLQSMH